MPMKRLLAVITATLLLWTLPVAAEHKTASYLDLVRWAGCRAELVTSDDVEMRSSNYTTLDHTLYIGTKVTEGLRPDLAEMILFHEIGHCLQDQEGMLGPGMEIMRIELDADRHAANLACGLGRDGTRLLRELFEWAKVTFNYDGDYIHGTLDQRIAQASHASMC